MDAAADQYFLETESEAVGQRYFPLHNTQTILFGRDRDCYISIKDARVSRHHAQLEWVDEGIYLRDLGSSNGTRVNGFNIEKVELQVGDRIEIGDSLFTLRGPTRADNKDNGLRCDYCGRWLTPNLNECPGCGAPLPYRS